ncbi:hypothetical protein LDC48_002017 [Listeria monocytogenes]|nr:hypothetical protein [Listeria monocytogenes]EKE4537049.1 hypothetical protein [Listeria monocytogenes]HBI6111373.1 hypothetical protein [Listeria monocytogenes]
MYNASPSVGHLGMKSTIDRKKRSDLTFPLKPKHFLNIFKSEPMREKPGIMEYNKFIIVTKGVDIKTLLSGVSDLNRRENIEYFLVQNTIMTYQILEGEVINFYAKDLGFLVDELAL